MSTAVVPVSAADSQTVSIGPITGDVPVRTYPSEVPILGQVHRNYRFIKSLTLTIERDEDGSYVVSDDVFGIFGHDFNLVDAMKDYISAFASYYELLSTHDDAPTVALFQELRRYFQPNG